MPLKCWIVTVIFPDVLSKLFKTRIASLPLTYFRSSNVLEDEKLICTTYTNSKSKTQVNLFNIDALSFDLKSTILPTHNWKVTQFHFDHSSCSWMSNKHCKIDNNWMSTMKEEQWGKSCHRYILLLEWDSCCSIP